MNLVEMLSEYESNFDGGETEVMGAPTGIEISGLRFASRDVQNGNMFFCISGGTHDGHEYASQAIERGAVALIVERELVTSVPQVVVRNSREAMGYFSCIYYGFPSKELDVIGVTGTNGKSSITNFFHQIPQIHLKNQKLNLYNALLFYNTL